MSDLRFGNCAPHIRSAARARYVLGFCDRVSVRGISAVEVEVAYGFCINI